MDLKNVLSDAKQALSFLQDPGKVGLAAGAASGALEFKLSQVQDKVSDVLGIMKAKLEPYYPGGVDRTLRELLPIREKPQTGLSLAWAGVILTAMIFMLMVLRK